MNQTIHRGNQNLVTLMKGLLVAAIVVGVLGVGVASVAGLAIWAEPEVAEAASERQPAPTPSATVIPAVITEPVETPMPETVPAEEPEPTDALAAEPEEQVLPEPEPSRPLTAYMVKPGDTLADIARVHGVTVDELIAANGIQDANVIYVGQELRIPDAGPEVPAVETPESLEESQAPEVADAAAWQPIFTPADPSQINEARWIDVDLSEQRVTAYEGQTPVRSTLSSTGLPRTPTPEGQFRIWIKLRYDDMAGPGYYLEDVPYVMYFYQGYGLHGVFWHGNFGHPMSHGCVNLPTPEAEWLFNWADLGTLVNVHE